MTNIMKLADAYASVSSEFDALDFPMTKDLVIRDKSRADLHTVVNALIEERDALAAKLATFEFENNLFHLYAPVDVKREVLAAIGAKK